MNRKVIVTGGAQGIGEAIVRRLAADGATIAILDRNSERARTVAASVGNSSIAVDVDLADADATKAACDAVIDSFGGLDVLVNDAGIFAKAPIVDMAVETWDTLFTVNVRAMFLTTQACAPALMASPHGAIVNIASMAAKKGTPGEAAYAASKAAVVALTRISALEFGTAGVTANSVCPGYVLTEMGAATRTPEQVAEWSAGSPLGRCTEAHEVADLVAFLASDQARGMTGQALNITAGMATW